MERFATYSALINERVAQWVASLPHGTLYAPMAYLLGSPAKRLRPIAMLMCCEAYGKDPASVLDEALGIELFHTFTLMHDDIMDEAPLRRGRPTVHTEWSVNTAILSGDAMLVKAYQLMAHDPAVLGIFSECALSVCEGQQLDMELAEKDDASPEAYLEMIRLKTAVLLACSMRIGAIRGGASVTDAGHLERFGEQIGLAFQLRDDLLDAFGDPDKVGKQRGGDLKAGKRTWLLIHALEKSHAAGDRSLVDELARPAADRDVARMLDVMEQLDVHAAATREVERHTTSAMVALEKVALPLERKAPLLDLATYLLERAY